jgi:alanine racemase
MDQCMIDLTDAGGAEIGDEVILFGGGSAPSVDELTRMLDTIPHEITCDIARRVPRVYKKAGKIVETTNYLD